MNIKLNAQVNHNMEPLNSNRTTFVPLRSTMLDKPYIDLLISSNHSITSKYISLSVLIVEFLSKIWSFILFTNHLMNITISMYSQNATHWQTFEISHWTLKYMYFIWPVSKYFHFNSVYNFYKFHIAKNKLLYSNYLDSIYNNQIQIIS